MSMELSEKKGNVIDELESIDLDLEDFETIEKGNFNRIDYPAVRINKRHIYYNKMSIPFLKDAKSIKYRMSKDYILIETYREKAEGAFAVNPMFNKNTLYGLATAFPAKMNNRGIADGYYKLYKSGNRFAIKRYEPFMLLE